MEGESLGRYRLRGVLGQGGMGRLYLAEQHGIEGFTKIVALKRILPHLADSPHFRELFLNEARVAARLEHPNIVATYELGEDDGSYFISMEYLPGEDLGAVLSRCSEQRAMPLEIAAALAQQSANGLHYAHEARNASGQPFGLVHRDVNPSNIFVTYYGMVKLLDFGIVKGPESASRTSPGVFKGKYGYAAPEQIEGDPLDRCTDVFCLGIVLWECLTGRRLFDAPSDGAAMDAVRRRPIPAPSTLRPEVPPELDEITLRALNRTPSQRFASAHDLSEALDRFLARREVRPTSKSVGQWLESLFGADRASWKKAIAQGSDVDGALAQLAALSNGKVATPPTTASGKERLAARPRALWSTSLSVAGSTPASLSGRPSASMAAVAPLATRSQLGSPVPSAPSPRSPALATTAAPAPRGSRTTTIVAIAGLAALTGAIGLGLLSRRGERTAEQSAASAGARGGISVQSDPSGAHVFLDGDPTGLVTPAVINGLRAGKTIELRLDKPGYAPAVERIAVAAGAATTRAFRLVAAAGTVRFAGVPERASVYVDDAPIDPAAAQLIPLGPHKLRVEVEGEVVGTRSFNVQPGEQTVSVRRSQGGQ